MDLFKKILTSAKKGELTYVGGYTLSYAGTTSTKNITLTSLTGGLDTQPSKNDIVVIFYAASGDLIYSPTATAVSGYTEIHYEFIDASLNDLKCRAMYKIMGDTPDTSLDIPGGTGNANCAGSISIQVWKGVNRTTPLDVSKVTNTVTTTVKPNPTSITPITKGAFVIAMGAGSHAAGTQTFSSSDLDSFISSGANDSVDATSGMGSYEWTSGAFDAVQWTFSGPDQTHYVNCAIAIALRPA